MLYTLDFLIEIQLKNVWNNLMIWVLKNSLNGYQNKIIYPTT